MAKGAKDQLTFEKAVERLEEIVEQMESAELPLDEIIERYEEGMKLLGLCEGKLKAAEAKIELLTKNKSGKLTRSEFETPASVDAGDSGPDKDSGSEADDGEVSLF